ncbi:MAG: sigma 54-interacting transcriptional regulator [Nitrospiraceae bacterium]|nr:sigma 54-interacting transcriptional regulator [Nitrospiraceae bacterium]
MEHKGRILVIDDEESIRFTFDAFLSDEGYSVQTAGSYDQAVGLLGETDFDVVFADIILGGRTGIDVMREARRRGLTCPVVMVTGAPNVETASEAVRLGAFDYIPKPVHQETLLHVAKMAHRHKALNDEAERYRKNIEAIFRSVKDGIVTVDDSLKVVEINEAAQAICGVGREAIGQDFGSVAAFGCGKACLDALTETIEKKSPAERTRIECIQEGSPGRVVTLSAAPLLDHHGLFSGAVLVIRDETRLSDLERDLNERRQFHTMIGVSGKMQEIYNLIENLADVQSTVLVTGESGTGKELVAEALHYKGVRGSRPLVKVNCSALSENLLESELFGHVKGAFTGAVKDKIGRFQRADGGTIFLDEIGDISHRIQLGLLRVLQEMEFERVGDSTPIRVDVRVIAATNRDLESKVKRGEFREDLYYRLKVVEMALPPLRERTEDIPFLVNHFLEKFNKKMGKKISAVSADVQARFMDYPWPGNIRELEHTMEHAFILCRQNMISVEHLPGPFRDLAGSGARALREKERNEPDEILKALEKTAWNKAKAARLLGFDRKTLYRKMEKYRLLNHES